MKIGQKITLGFIIIILPFMLTGGIHIANFITTKSQIDWIIASNIEELESAEEVFDVIQENHATILQLLVDAHNKQFTNPISQANNPFKNSQDKARTSMNTLEQATLNQIENGDPEGEEDELREIQLLKGHVNDFFEMAGTITALLEAGEIHTASSHSEDSLLPLSLHVQALVSDLEMDAKEEIEAALTEAREHIQGSIWTGIIMCFIAVIAAVCLSRYMSKNISTNINKLHAATGQLGKGKLDSRVDINSGDEIGQIAEDINRMAEGLRSAIVSRDDLAKEVSERQQAEQALKISDEKFRMIFESSNDSFMLLDRDKFLDCNAATLRMFGCASRDEFLQTHPSEFSPSTQPDGKSSRESADEKIKAVYEGTSKLFEWAHKRSNGELFPAEVMLTRLNLEGKDILMASVRDLTERKQVENALKVIQDQHNEAQRIAHLGHWTLDLIKNELIWSDENHRIFGVEPGTENTYETFLDIVHPDDYEFVDLAYMESVKNRLPYDIEHRLLMKDGSIKWVNERCETEYADDGSPLRSIGTTLDITEQKHAEEALRASEKHTRLLIDSMAEAIYGLDLNGNCTFANAACLKMLGYDHFSELIGKNMHKLMHHTLQDGSPYPEKECRACLAFRTGKAYHVDDEVFWRRKGSSFPVSYWARPVYKDNQISGSVVTFLDITEQIKARADLIKSKQQLRTSLEGTVTAVGRAVGARDPYTAGHQNRVAEISAAIAHEMGLDEERIKGIYLGASIHDIGKIQTPADLLSKPTKLSAIEYSLIQAHAQAGYDILKDISFPWPIAEIAWQHHERVNGTGYPQGLTGDEMCLEARIVAVADTVEAISSHRPYRPALGIDVALDEIKAKRGEFYDPIVVDSCLKIFTEKGFRISTS